MPRLPKMLIDTPSPFAPMKRLQDFLDRATKQPTPWPPELAHAIKQVRQSIARQKANPQMFRTEKDNTGS